MVRSLAVETTSRRVAQCGAVGRCLGAGTAGRQDRERARLYKLAQLRNERENIQISSIRGSLGGKLAAGSH